MDNRLVHLEGKKWDVEWEIQQVIRAKRRDLEKEYLAVGVPKRKNSDMFCTGRQYENLREFAEKNVGHRWDNHLARLQKKLNGIMSDIERLKNATAG